MCLTYILLLVFFTAFSTINTRSVEQDPNVELLLNNRITENKQLWSTISNYRHRFEHSPNFKALRWAVREQLNPPYCPFCHLFVPVVS